MFGFKSNRKNWNRSSIHWPFQIPTRPKENNPQPDQVRSRRLLVPTHADQLPSWSERTATQTTAANNVPAKTFRLSCERSLLPASNFLKTQQFAIVLSWTKAKSSKTPKSIVLCFPPELENRVRRARNCWRGKGGAWGSGAHVKARNQREAVSGRIKRLQSLPQKLPANYFWSISGCWTGDNLVISSFGFWFSTCNLKIFPQAMINSPRRSCLQIWNLSGRKHCNLFLNLLSHSPEKHLEVVQLCYTHKTKGRGNKNLFSSSSSRN